ncbi:MAG: hypothetical protein K2R98_20555 [Gemmataceae bacterium]|nr:hypothetical protein [Gemmataceae bacterium]
MKRTIVIAVVILFVAGGLGALVTMRRMARSMDVQSDMNEIGLAYFSCIAQHKVAPTKLEELQAHLKNNSGVPERVRDGRLVVVWGVPPRSDPKDLVGVVLAYEKDAPEKGGWVCMGDFKARHMNAAAFEAALRVK